jgi:tripartite ATP-independent transporter DctM subunit
MDPLLLSIIAIIIFLALLTLGMHIGISLMVAGFVGMYLFRGFDQAVSELYTISWGTVTNFGLAVIPLFMLMGNFAMYSGITQGLFDACYKWVGSFRGGLGFVAVATSSLFHCFCGSATATTATIGTVCYPEMTRYKYKPTMSAAIIASSSAFGLLIPPSIGFIIYCMMSNVSVAKMFAAGIVPAIIVIGMSFVTIIILAKRDPESMPKGEKFTLREKFASLKGIIGFALLFILVLGGIFSGFCSPSEGGAIGAFGSFIIMIIKRAATKENILRSLLDSIKTTSMIFVIMIGANIFGTFLAMSQMPAKLATSLSNMDASPYVVLWIVVAVYIILGMCIDTLPLITILTPIFWPLVLSMGWDPLWFGIVMVMCMLIGLISPPDGVPCYIMASISGVPLMKVFKACLPFLIMLVLATVLFVYVQPLSTWLPNLLYG